MLVHNIKVLECTGNTECMRGDFVKILEQADSLDPRSASQTNPLLEVRDLETKQQTKRREKTEERLSP